MALDKAIESGREHRRDWRGKNRSKAVDRSCRNHGDCPWCRGNRFYQKKKELEKIDEDFEVR